MFSNICYFKIVFKDSLDHINWLNGQRVSPKSAVYGITQFSDLTPNEFEIMSIT